MAVNAENAAGGRHAEHTANELFDAKPIADAGQPFLGSARGLTYIVREPRLLRPVNYPPLMDAPGRGANLFETRSGRRVLVINVLGRVHMDPMDDPFGAVDRELEATPLGMVCDAAIVDMHAEATSEKMAMGHFCDGRASLVVGTHTHVPTADAQILNGGTAYMTDAGACASYDSVIGNDKEEPLRHATTRMSGGRYTPASGTRDGVRRVHRDRRQDGPRHAHVEPIRVGGDARAAPHSRAGALEDGERVGNAGPQLFREAGDHIISPSSLDGGRVERWWCAQTRTEGTA